MEILKNNELNALIGVERAEVWCRLTACIDQLYDVDRIWNNGFGEWLYEYKYRRGGKTLCTFYAKKDAAVILIIFGKNEREKFELQRDIFSSDILALYDEAKSYHDGKWLWIPLENGLSSDDISNMLRIKRRPNRK
ncbi:MAG: DUF3788 domain-containing protein [Oscillospiraceae bacterium]